MTEIARREDNLPAIPMQSAPAALVEWAQAASAANQLARPLCQTEFVPTHFRGNEAAATAAILYGAEAGLSPLQALQGIYVISGRPALYARTMLAVTLAAGHEVYTEESTDVRAVVNAKRRGTQNTERVVVTIDQAKKAGWTKNSKYTTEPATMLLARAQSQACRRIAPDAMLGMAYSAEELQDDDGSPAPIKRTARRTAKAEPAPSAEPDLEPDDAGAITPAQLTKLHACLGSLGITDREEGLAVLSDVAGRDLDTSKALTRDEATAVIDHLERRAREVGEPEPVEPAVEPGFEGWPTTARPGGDG